MPHFPFGSGSSSPFQVGRILGRGFALLAALLGALTVSAATGPQPLRLEWRESTPTPEPRGGYAAGTLDGRLIIIGGSYWEGQKGDWRMKHFTSAVHAFEPKSERWEKLPDAPVTVCYAGYARVGDEIHVLGGLQNGVASADTWILRRGGAGFEWRRGRPLPEPRLFPAVAVIGSTIYVIGGTREFEPFDAKGSCCTSQSARNTVWRADLSAPQSGWVELEPYPAAARWAHRAIADGGVIYVFGGFYQATAKDAAVSYDEVLRFDPAAKTWTRVGDMPPGLQVCGLVRAKGQILLIGANRLAMRFNPADGTFSAIPALPRDANVDHFAWIEPYVVGASGENKEDGPRRRSEWTFVGRLE
ncbi:MAG: hypothetical protein JNG83_00640 [Opitutaceae bacterium]|nr:hypothetical protein [Opitutaceae bacterium]